MHIKLSMREQLRRIQYRRNHNYYNKKLNFLITKVVSEGPALSEPAIDRRVFVV